MESCCTKAAIFPHSIAPCTPSAWQGAGNSHEVPASKNIRLHIAKNCDLYMQALADFVQGPGEPLYIIKGKYKTQQAAAAAMTAGQNWLSGELTATTTVMVQLQQSANAKEQPPTLPPGPCSLEAVLQALSEAGYVRPRLQGHEVTRLDGHRFQVQASGSTVFEVTVIDGTAVGQDKQEKPPPKATPANVSGYIDLAAVKKSPYLQIITKLQFNMGTNRFIFGYPEVHFNKAYRFQKGDFLNLAWT